MLVKCKFPNVSFSGEYTGEVVETVRSINAVNYPGNPPEAASLVPIPPP
jgi:hypothetical protein